MKDPYLLLFPDCTLRLLESPYVYKISTDDLYELDAEGFDFLKKCRAGVPSKDTKELDDFVSFCLEEKVLMYAEKKRPSAPPVQQSPVPSLRYLELLLTYRCNLKCRHCYLGTSRDRDLPLRDTLSVLKQFEKMGGLRVLLSGGEPLLSPYFWEINQELPTLKLRFILLTNATLINRENVKILNIHEVQVSIDGWEDSHDRLRGKGSFKKAMDGIRALRENGVGISIATIVHRYNLKDFEKLKAFTEEIAASSWNIDFLCNEGYAKEYDDVFVPYKKASPFIDYSFGKNYHQAGGGYSCGPHLACVTPKGDVCKCGYFEDEPVGNIKEGLLSCWLKIPKIKLDELECDCGFIEECRGGCRYRAKIAGGIYSKDKAKCSYFNI